MLGCETNSRRAASVMLPHSADGDKIFELLEFHDILFPPVCRWHYRAIAFLRNETSTLRGAFLRFG